MRLLKVLFISASILAATASAATITQTVNIPLSGTLPTDVSNAQGVFSLFGSTAAPVGSTLNSVTLEIVINESLTGLTLHNIGGADTSNTHYVGSANFDANDTQNGTDATNLDAALSNSGNQGDPLATIANINAGAIAIGAMFTCTASAPCNLPRTVSVDTGVVSGTTASYTGSGTFGVGFSTESSFQVTGFGGNNVNVTQTNVASAVATVVYNYTPGDGSPTPEPAGMALLGGGLVALGVIGRRKRAKH
ncbi:exported hypothetical protein [Candidatus Sulfopaludibacter sp. SbA3]|nr:exported hypothetical protein [Candidatus Sulfopaludibacter sp. SbA3]